MSESKPSRKIPPNYETKFAEFIRLCEKTNPGDAIVVPDPYTLGDTYEEVIESLFRLTDSEVHLRVMPSRE